jgi:hypothetical protein
MIEPRTTAFYPIVFVFLFVASCTIGFGQGCPTINLETPSTMTKSGDVFTVHAVVKSTGVVGNISYNWTVTSGTIVKGQDSATLFVDTSGEERGKNITVKVTVSGLPSVCQNTASDVVSIALGIVCGLPADEFGALPANDVMAHVDNIFVSLDFNVDATAVFEMKFSDSETRPARILRITRILEAIKDRKYDISKVAFLISKDEGNTTTVSILPLSTDMSAWINRGVFIYGKDIKHKLSTLFKDK